MHGPELEVIIPALNEESRIGPVLGALAEFLAGRPWSSSVVVVDNGCTDRTLEVADEVTSHVVPVRVIGCSRRGKGAAVRRGIFASSARYVGFCDADLSTPVETIAPVVKLLTSGHPVVIGSRRCSGAEYVDAQPVRRRVGGAVFRSVARSVAPSVSDTQCGFKFFHTHIAKALFSKATADGFAFDAEVVGLALAAGINGHRGPCGMDRRGGLILSPSRGRIRGDEGASRGAFTFGTDCALRPRSAA